MKKFVVLSLISFLILAFGATVYGQEKAPVLEFKASGFIDVITEYVRNVPNPGLATTAGGGTWATNSLFNPYRSGGHYMLPGGTLTTAGTVRLDDQAFNNKMAYVENRGRLKFDAIMGKEMSGTFQFEFDSLRWGERAGTGAQRQQAGHWGVADRSALELKHMYLTFGVPWIPVPTTLQAGIIPMAIRPGVFLSVDGPGIQAAFKVDPATIKLMWAKAGENRDWAADDSDLYAIEANAKIQTITVGGYYLLFNMNTYPLEDNLASDAARNSPNYSSNMSWAGLYTDGKLGPVNLNFDFVYDWGEVRDRRDRAATARAADVKFKGFGARLNVGYPWEKLLFGFTSIYGSGADLRKTSASALPGTTAANGTAISSKAGTYIVPAGTEGSMGESLILTGAGINRGNTGWEYAAATTHSAANFGGLWINKLYAGYTVSPQFSTRVEGMYIRDTTKHGDTHGTTRKSSKLVNDPEDEKLVGYEIDWFNTLSIYKNLTFQFGFGYLFAGKAMDFWDPITSSNKETKDPWIITTNLTYSF